MNQEVIRDYKQGEWCEPEELLNSNRFDLPGKYLFANWRGRGIDSDWHKIVYLSHIRVFNGYFEVDGTGKQGQEGFLHGFEKLLDSIRDDGFDAMRSKIPVGSNGLLLDGAHRIAACLYYQAKVFRKLQSTRADLYNYEWFLKRGLEPQVADAIAVEACHLLKQPFIIVVYPAARGREGELEAIIRRYGEIWYKKKQVFKNLGPINLVRQIYCDEPWLGSWKNGFAGAQNKASWCFTSSDPVRVYLVASGIEAMRKAKEEIRQLYAVENHSVHINDTKPEAIHLANLLLNDNSVQFMNICNMTPFKWFLRLLGEYKAWLADAGYDVNDYCIDGSSTLAAAGIREARDIDFLHRASASGDTGLKEISSHNHEVHWYGRTVDDIVCNPCNHFYYEGIKFASLRLVGGMKKQRGEAKDQEDVKAIVNVLDKGLMATKPPLVLRLKKLTSPRYVYQQARFLALKVRYLLNVLRRKKERAGS